MTELCEWDPENDRPAEEWRLDGPVLIRHGCKRDAVISVGHNGLWHLCRECASLPRFKRYRRREELRMER